MKSVKDDWRAGSSLAQMISLWIIENGCILIVLLSVLNIVWWMNNQVIVYCYPQVFAI